MSDPALTTADPQALDLSRASIAAIGAAKDDGVLSEIVLSSSPALGAVSSLFSPLSVPPPVLESFTFKNLKITSEVGHPLPEYENDGVCEECFTINISIYNAEQKEITGVSLCGLNNPLAMNGICEGLVQADRSSSCADKLVSKEQLCRLLSRAGELGAQIRSDVGVTPERIAEVYEQRLSANYNREPKAEILSVNREDGKIRKLDKFSSEAIKSGKEVVWLDIDATLPNGIVDRNAVQQLVEKSFPKLFSNDGNTPRGRSRDFEFFDVRLYEEENDVNALFAVRRKKVGAFVGENLFVTVHDGAAEQISRLHEQYLSGKLMNTKEVGAGSLFLDLMFESARSADRILDGFEQTIEDLETYYGRKRKFPSERTLTHDFPRIREATDYMAAKFGEIDNAFTILSRSVGKQHFQKMFGELDADTALQDIEHTQGQVASRGKKAMRLRERIDYLVSTHNTVVNTRAETIQAKLAIIGSFAIPLAVGPQIVPILQDPKPAGVATLIASAALSLGLFGWGVWKRALHI